MACSLGLFAAASLFKASLLIGAVLAGASEKDIQLLGKAAEHIGYCFDIQDDIIDTFASEEQYGRRPGGDLSKHKPLHIIYTYSMANQFQLETLKNAIHESSPKELAEIRKVISDCGALEAAKSHSREHADSAKNLILHTGISSEVKNLFNSFINYVKESLNWYK